jgi:hypothetical protein
MDGSAGSRLVTISPTRAAALCAFRGGAAGAHGRTVAMNLVVHPVRFVSLQKS